MMNAHTRIPGERIGRTEPPDTTTIGSHEGLSAKKKKKKSKTIRKCEDQLKRTFFAKPDIFFLQERKTRLT